MADLERVLGRPATDSVGGRVSSRASHLILLTERGIFLACLKTNKPAGVELRRWLASEVLPALGRGRALAPAGQAGARSIEEGRALVPEAREIRCYAKELLAIKAITPHGYVEILRQGFVLLCPDPIHLISAPTLPGQMPLSLPG